ncbi:hypothetical protein ACLTEW_24415 [Gordonia lacunae]|uniref:hypothetical protein n=1 Tax=Gordonia TaxID=2053 RepID=UPI00200A7044|nr:hypothetical protein [Gordonia terrae]UPW12012.1 hypothetical protein M1C59_25510 [Gordonia terrae]
MVAVAVCVGSFGAGVAAATPEDGEAPAPVSTRAGGKKLPAGFPAPLKQYVAGTDEFKKASWFTGACADKGGDFAAYLAATFPVEAELQFWSRPEDERANLLVDRFKADVTVSQGNVSGLQPTIDSVEKAKKEMAGGFRPTPDNKWLPGSYPGPRTEEYPSTTPVCAQDLARWGNKAISTWGFEFAEQPDAQSITTMAGGDAALEGIIKEPCSGSRPESVWFCNHAFYLDCAKATDGADVTKCTQWNTQVGKLFRGTKNWIDQNSSLGDRIAAAARVTLASSPAYRLGKAQVDAYSSLWGNTIGAVTEFVKDAKELPEKWANYIKQAAMDMTTTVLPGLATVGEFDLRQGWFIKWYAMSTALGLAVMIVMFLLATVRAGRNGGGSALVRDTLGYLPTAIMAMLYTPFIAWMLQSLAKAITMSIAQLMGTSMDEVVDNVSAMLGGLTNETLVGGAVGGIIGFGVLAFGAFALFLGLLMHQIGIPLACVACAIGYGMLVHPTWRRKALRVPMMLITLIFSTPLLFLALAIIIQVINWSAAESTTGDGKLESWGALALCALAFFVVGIAPFSLLKWSPLLPTTEDADRMGDGGAGTGQVIGAGMGGPIRAAHNGAASPSAGGGSGGLGGGGGEQGARHAAAAASHHSSPGGGGGAHSGSTGAAKHAGSSALKGVAAAGGPVSATAARLASAAGRGGQIAGDMAKSGVAAGTRAGALNASQRAHGIATDSAPTQTT